MTDRATKPAKPKSGSQTRKRKKNAQLPCTPEELAEVQTRAEKAGLKVSGYLRALVFGKETQQPRAARRPTVEAAELGALRYELRKIGGNLNQLAHAQNQGKALDSAELAALIAKHSEALSAVLAALGKESAQ